MKNIYVPSAGPDCWRKLLADPSSQWETGYSAKALAHCWEAEGLTHGLPKEIADILTIGNDKPELLLGLPEHQVPLPGSSRAPSQSDLFALIRIGPRTLAATVEGKVDEPFGELLGDWLAKSSPGKRTKLAHICKILGLEERALPFDLRYQLLHRVASAVIEAERFKTDAAVMLVHSFSAANLWFDDFAKFAALFGCNAEPGKLIPVRPSALRPLYLGWVRGDAQYLGA